MSIIGSGSTAWVARFDENKTLNLNAQMFSGGTGSIDTASISPDGLHVAYARQIGGSGDWHFCDYSLNSTSETSLANYTEQFGAASSPIDSQFSQILTGFTPSGDPIFLFQARVYNGHSGFDAYEVTWYIQRFGTSPNIFTLWTAITPTGGASPEYDNAASGYLIATDNFGGDETGWFWHYFDDFTTRDNYLTKINLQTGDFTDITFEDTPNSATQAWVPLWVVVPGRFPGVSKFSQSDASIIWSVSTNS